MQAFIPPLTYTTEKLWRAVRVSGLTIASLAEAVGFHPSALGMILNQRRKVRRGDPRIVWIGDKVGVSKRALFEEPGSAPTITVASPRRGPGRAAAR